MLAAPRLQPITHREGSITLAPAVKVHSNACTSSRSAEALKALQSRASQNSQTQTRSGFRGDTFPVATYFCTEQAVGLDCSGCMKARSRDPLAPKEFVSPSATMAHMTQLIMPQHANSLAITFGGQVRSSPQLQQAYHKILTYVKRSLYCIRGADGTAATTGHALDGAVCVHRGEPGGQGQPPADWQHGQPRVCAPHQGWRLHVHHSPGDLEWPLKSRQLVSKRLGDQSDSYHHVNSGAAVWIYTFVTAL